MLEPLHKAAAAAAREPVPTRRQPGTSSFCCDAHACSAARPFSRARETNPPPPPLLLTPPCTCLPAFLNCFSIFSFLLGGWTPSPTAAAAAAAAAACCGIQLLSSATKQRPQILSKSFPIARYAFSHVGHMNGAPEKRSRLQPVLFLALLAWGAGAQQGRLVPACAPPGQIFSCRNCTGRSVAAPALPLTLALTLPLFLFPSPRGRRSAVTSTRRYVSTPRASQCGWCGSINRDSTQGICMSQNQLDGNPSLCYAFDPFFRVSPNGAAGGGCDALNNDSAALAIGLGVFYGVTLLSSLVLAYVVRSRRRGSCAQVACWFTVGVVFSVMAWYMLQCWGPKPRNHSQPQSVQETSNVALPPEFTLGSAPPASASVEAATLYRPFEQQQFPAQQSTMLYLPDARPPPFNPHAFPAPHAAPAYAAPAWQGQGRL
jgi:hypothetical protein